MAGGDAAAWAQAYLSAAAIVVSGALAVFVPWNERRLNRKRQDEGRLAVECRRSTGGGLEVTFSYTPEFQSYAVGVSVAVLEPGDARVYKGKIVEHQGADGYSAFERVIGGLGQNVRYNAISLLRTNEPSFAPETLRGVVFVEYPDEREGPFRVKARIDVLIHGNFRIFTRTMNLTAIDDEYYAQGGPIAVITGSRPGA